MKPIMKPEFRQIREHLQTTHGRSVVSLPSSMPFVANSLNSIQSLSRKMVTMIVNKSKKGGFR